MSTKKLRDTLSALHPLSSEFWSALEERLTLLSFPKHHKLLEAPAISNHAYYLNDGFAMSYFFHDGKKHIENFWQPSQIILSPKSFFEQVASKEFIQLTAPSEVLCISHKDVFHLFDLYKEALAIYRYVMNQYYERARERIWDIHHLTADERFTKLLVTYPLIEQHVSQEQIASYLGITPQTLSRLKRNRET